MSLIDGTLFTPMMEEENPDVAQAIMKYINLMEGWNIKCKNLVWSAPKQNIHTELLKFSETITHIQGELAKEYMGIFGKMQPNAIKPIQDDCLNAHDFIACIKAQTFKFYESIPCEPVYKGIGFLLSKFIHIINMVDYGFHLCDIRPY